MSAPFVEVAVDRVALMPYEDVEVVMIDPSGTGPVRRYEVHLAMGADRKPRIYVSDGVDVLDWSERLRRVCGCGTVVKDGPGPETHSICQLCEEVYELELENENGPAGGDGGQAVDPITPGHEGGDALRQEGIR